jgi:hydrogenase-4 component B
MILIAVQFAVVAAALSGVAAFALRRFPVAAKFISLFFLGSSGAAAVFAGIATLAGALDYSFFSSASSSSAMLRHEALQPLVYQLPSVFPNGAWQFQLDSLAAFFLMLVGIVVVAVSIYAYGYLRSYERQQHEITGMSLFTGLFVAGMYLVLLANEVFTFMLAWELMSIASYFLVAYHHENPNNRSAAFLYLLMAHISGLLIFVAYGVLLRTSNGFDFAALHAAVGQLPQFWVNGAFILALLGFGMKAGIVPLHVWLPRAHPVAPSHISALMSGVMLKVAFYGLVRFCFSLLGSASWRWEWGALLLFIGIVSAVVGILYALVQTDLKKLLAYSSVENIGIIFAGLGLAIIFFATKHQLLGALGLIATFYHCLNHALFKSLLFLGAGAILQHTHEHDLEKMGGLIHKMPHTAFFFLIGCLSIAALPPFNGFVSEWLLLQTALHATTSASWFDSGMLRVFIPIAAALVVLTGALAATCFAKVYGVAFLGQARTRNVRHAKDPHWGMRWVLGGLALLCLLCGVMPTLVLRLLNIVVQQLLGFGLHDEMTRHWLWVMPFAFVGKVSYSAPLVFATILLVWLLGYIGLRTFYKYHRSKIVKPWECGFGGLTTRMQYSATAFAMPLRRVFNGAWPVTERVEFRENGESDEAVANKNQENTNHKSKVKVQELSYSLQIGSWIWQYIYEPLGRGIVVVARWLARIQSGNIRHYLGYTFATLIILLVLISW